MSNNAPNAGAENLAAEWYARARRAEADLRAAMKAPDEMRHAAALTVAEYAHDTDDARVLLAMLGLEGS